MGKWSDELLAPEAAPAEPGRYSQMLGLVPRPDEQIDPQSSSAAGAGALTIGKASFIDNPESRARYFAERRGIPLDRYRVIGNDVVYQGDDGQWYREVPEVSFADPGTIPQRIAAGAGPALPAAAGAAAGIATAPMAATGIGLMGTLGATAAAGAGGEAAKDAIGSYLAGESQMDVASPLQEGAAAGLGQGIGAGIGAFLGRHGARDLDRLNRPAAQALQRRAQAQGIQLTPAEVTGLPSLKAQQTMLGNLPRSADRMAEFVKRRESQQVAPAVQKFLERVSPQDSAELAGEAAQKAAKGAREGLKAARSSAASPHYQAAKASGAQVDASDALAYLDGRIPEAKGAIKTALENVRKLLDGETRVGALHEAKVEIDRMLKGGQEARSSAEAFIKRDLMEVKSRLTAALGKASPDYEAGRAAFEAGSAPITALDEGLVGVLNRMQPGSAKDAATKLLSPSSAGPEAILKARAALEKQDPAAWQAIKRAHLQNAWAKAQREFASSAETTRPAGAHWRAALLGDKAQRANLKAALSPEEFKALEDLGEVLEATARVLPRGSHTAFMQEGLRDFEAQALGPASGAARFAAGPLSAVRDFIERAAMGRHAERLAEIVTSPDGMARLRELRQLSPTSRRYVMAVGQLLGISGRAAAGEVLDGGGAPRPIPPRPQM